MDGAGGWVVGCRVLPWFSNNAFPLYLAPMAGVTDLIFRQICKELGADVMVTEFVSAEGIMQADERTRKYTEFTDEQRPVGVQLFGADGERMGEAAMQNPWVFREAKHFLETGAVMAPVAVEERWELVIRHCRIAVDSQRNGNEKQTLTAMRSRLMAYCKGFPGAKELRQKLCHVSSVAEVEDLAAHSLGAFELAEL